MEIDTETIEKFHLALETGDKTQIKRIFISAIRNEASVETIRYMVENGVDPRMEDDYPLLCAVEDDNTDMVFYFYRECGASPIGIRHVAIMVESSNKVFEIFVQDGITITDKAIKEIFDYEDWSKIKFLINNSIAAERIAKLFFRQIACSYSNGYFMKVFLESNVDFHQILESVCSKFDIRK